MSGLQRYGQTKPCFDNASAPAHCKRPGWNRIVRRLGVAFTDWSVRRKIDGHTHLSPPGPSLTRGGVWAGWVCRVHTPSRVPGSCRAQQRATGVQPPDRHFT